MLAAFAVIASASCSEQPEPDADGEVTAPDVAFETAAGDDSSNDDGPEVVVGSPPAFRAAGADPGTALGALRARHLRVWTPELDWAFPPHVCDSAWELDAIAEPDPGADTTRLDSLETAAALAVMRYEYLHSRALHEPSALAQLCMAVGAVEPARSESLAVLETYLTTDSRRREPPAYPAEVVILGLAAASLLAVACVSPGYPTVATGGEVRAAPQAPARLQAYLLTVARGLEDAVTDVSLRVSQTTHVPAQNCAEISPWIAKWKGHVRDWIDEGQIWQELEATVTTAMACQPPSTDTPADCPHDWPA